MRGSWRGDAGCVCDGEAVRNLDQGVGGREGGLGYHGVKMCVRWEWGFFLVMVGNRDP